MDATPLGTWQTVKAAQVLCDLHERRVGHEDPLVADEIGGGDVVALLPRGLLVKLLGYLEEREGQVGRLIPDDLAIRVVSADGVPHVGRRDEGELRVDLESVCEMVPQIDQEALSLALIVLIRKGGRIWRNGDSHRSLVLNREHRAVLAKCDVVATGHARSEDQCKRANESKFHGHVTEVMRRRPRPRPDLPVR